MTTTRKCEGSRRKWRGHVFGTFKCGRKATGVLETRVGMSRRHNVCDDAECCASLSNGYPVSFRAFAS